MGGRGGRMRQNKVCENLSNYFTLTLAHTMTPKAKLEAKKEAKQETQHDAQ